MHKMWFIQNLKNLTSLHRTATATPSNTFLLTVNQALSPNISVWPH